MSKGQVVAVLFPSLWWTITRLLRILDGKGKSWKMRICCMRGRFLNYMPCNICTSIMLIYVCTYIGGGRKSSGKYTILINSMEDWVSSSSYLLPEQKWRGIKFGSAQYHSVPLTADPWMHRWIAKERERERDINFASNWIYIEKFANVKGI